MLTADRNTLSTAGELITVPVAAGAKIYAGALVAASATGYAQPGGVAATLTYLGRAEQYADNTGGAAGAITVQVRRKRAFYWQNSGTDPVTQASLGKTAYIVDDQTVSATNGGNTQSAAGIVVGLDANGVWID